MGKLITAGVVILIGLALLPGIRTALSGIYNTTNSTVGYSLFEGMIWRALPLILLIFIFVVAIWTFKGRRHDDGR